MTCTISVLDRSARPDQYCENMFDQLASKGKYTCKSRNDENHFAHDQQLELQVSLASSAHEMNIEIANDIELANV